MQLAVIRKETERILAEVRLTDPPVKLMRLGEFYVFRVELKDWPERYEGRLERGKRLISVNKNHSVVKQRFTIGHEFGHYFLHPTLDIFDDDGTHKIPENLEKEANSFAAELLMPKDWIKRDYQAIQDPDRLARRYEVSRPAMWYRLMGMRLIK